MTQTVSGITDNQYPETLKNAIQHVNRHTKFHMFLWWTLFFIMIFFTTLSIIVSNDIGYHTKDIALLVLPGIFGLFGLLAFIVIKAKQWSDWARFAVYLLHMVINFLSFFLTLQIYFLYCAFLDFNASLEMYRYKTNLNAEKTYPVVVP